jgi:hypothetical protein
VLNARRRWYSHARERENDPRTDRAEPVELLLRKLSEGATENDLLDAYPRLVLEDIRAALEYADAIAHEIILLPKTG